jgi:hypothetical protein
MTGYNIRIQFATDENDIHLYVDQDCRFSITIANCNAFVKGFSIQKY